MANDLLIKTNGLVDNHSARRLAPVVPTSVSKDADDIVEYEEYDVVKKVGEGEEDFVIDKRVRESGRCNRQAYIMKDANDVGVLNILEKVRRSGDITLLNQTGAIIPDGVQDYTSMPNNIGDALKAVEQGANSFAALKEIFGDISFDQLATMSPEQLSKVLGDYVASKQVAPEGENK